ncbi:MAG: hypothetical protein HY377_01535 [Candidatus Blackburnbacteria bacterium]|nr:hypothetical protein [Candidatus Blackburnbacteria bacterium]
MQRERAEPGRFFGRFPNFLFHREAKTLPFFVNGEDLSQGQRRALVKEYKLFEKVVKVLGWTSSQHLTENERTILEEYLFREFLRARCAQKTPRWDDVPFGLVQQHASAISDKYGLLEQALPRRFSKTAGINELTWDRSIANIAHFLHASIWNPNLYRFRVSDAASIEDSSDFQVLKDSRKLVGQSIDISS